MADNTKRLLVASLKNQLHKKTLNKITISDITNDAGVNRMTFYYHFHDIYELVEWAFEDEIFSNANGKTYTFDNWQEGVLDVMKVLLDNKSFVMNIYHSLNREQIENSLLSNMRDTIAVPLSSQLDKVGIPKEDRTFVIDFYLYGFMGTVLEWIDHDMKEAPETLVERFARLMNSTIPALIKSYSNPEA